MKYLKSYETRDILIDEYIVVIDELVKYYFKEYRIFSHIEDIGNYRNYKKIYFTLYETTKDFLVISINKNYHLVELFIQKLYTDLELFEKTNEFIEYFSSLVLPLSYSHDSNIEYYLYEDKLKKLISLLSIDEYKYRIEDINKYNL